MIFARKLGITALIVYTLVVSVVREFVGFTPNDFAEAHWLIDYRFGFIKRGLIGEIVSLVTGFFNVPVTVELITLLSSIAFAIFCIAITLLSIRLVQMAGWSNGAVLVTLVFLSSPFIVMNTHLIGYYDNIVIVLGLGSIVLLLKGRPWLGASLHIPALLMHENALVLAFAPFCLAWLLINTNRQKLGLARLSFLPLLLPVGAFVAIALHHDLFLPENFIELLTAHLSQFPFLQNQSNTTVPLWLASSFHEYFTVQSVEFGERISSIAMYGLVLPTIFAILFFHITIYRIRDFSFETLIILGFCFAPQLLHLIAWDTLRIWTYSILSAFLALWIYLEIFHAQEDTSTSRLLCLGALVANILMHSPHTGIVNDEHSPFGRLLLYLPVFIGVFVLMFYSERISMGERLSIQGSGITKVFPPTKRLLMSITHRFLL